MLRSKVPILAALGLGAVLLGCGTAPAPAPDPPGRSILTSSTPADGARVRGTVSRLELRFSPPARLGELVLTGADGMATPMMVMAPEETSYYSAPLPGLGAGAYTVQWTATARGVRHQGSLRFSVR